MQGNNHNSRESLPYLKIFPEEYLSSSLHYNCSLEAQGYFNALLCLAAKNRKERGSLSLEKGQPMPDNVIANALFIDLETHKKLWQLMIDQERISKREDGVWYITNFDYYQNKYRRSKNATNTSRQYAIEQSKEERTRKYVRQQPDVAEDELGNLAAAQQQVEDTNNEIDDLYARSKNIYTNT